MILKQFRFERLGQASYLFGCPRAKDSFVVDPVADLGVDFYVLEAADAGLAIVQVLETHVHADFISCARELAEVVGAEHRLFHTAPVRYAFAPLTARQTLDAGRVRLQVLPTPGHTPEHASYVVTDRSRSEEPWFVLTGDSLFVGDVGRPDLLVGSQALDVFDEAERARLQYRSIKDTLFALPDMSRCIPRTTEVPRVAA
jgi:hydroxyacylglutathione hydrolase